VRAVLHADRKRSCQRSSSASGSAARGCNPIYSGPNFGGPYGDAAGCGCMAADFINDHPIIALALLGAAGWGIYKARKAK
jgi:hypothetical protein